MPAFLLPFRFLSNINAGGNTLPNCKHNYKNKYIFSQNFLTNRRLIEKIVSLSTITKCDTVLEIGTGKGHLTGVLSQKCNFLFSIEIDEVLYHKSMIKLKKYNNIKLINEDFLNYSLPRKISYKVFANIPFSITTQLIDKLTKAPNPPDEMWLIVEKGAAKRFMGIKKETIKSLLLKPNWEIDIIFHFRRDDFHPKPSKDSVLLHFYRKHIPDIAESEFGAYKKFIEQSFKYGFFKKKSLLTKKQIATVLKLAELPSISKDGVILYIQWLCLFRCYINFIEKQKM